MIGQSLNDKHSDYKIIHAILIASHNLFAKSGPKKHYLSDRVSGHKIWKEVSKWKYWMYNIIEDRRKDQLERKKKAIKLKHKRQERTSELEESKGLFGRFLSGIT